MKEILSYCGFRCDLCPAFIKNIDKKVSRKIVSEKWKKYFGFEIPPDDIICVGCKNEGIHADKECPVRPCIITKKIENCAQCEKYSCEKLKSRIEFIENARNKIFDDITEEDYELYIRPYEGKKRLEKIKKANGA